MRRILPPTRANYPISNRKSNISNIYSRNTDKYLYISNINRYELEDTGILLLALGHELYLNLCINLAISIRANNINTPICIATTEELVSKVPDMYKPLINQYVIVDREFYFYNKTLQYGLAKVSLDILTPYNKTIFIDADSFFNPATSFENLFNKFQFGFWMHLKREINTYNIHDRFDIWASVYDMRQIFQFNFNTYEFNSSVIVFDKTNSITIDIFNKARYVLKTLSTSGKYNGWLDGMIPDELCFECAIGLLDYNYNGKFDDSILCFVYAGNLPPSATTIKNVCITSYATATGPVPHITSSYYNKIMDFYSGILNINKMTPWISKGIAVQKNNELRRSI